MWPWSCSMTTKASKPGMWNMVSAPNGPATSMPSAATASHRRLDDLDFLAAEQPAFAGVRIEPADGDLRRRDAEPLAAPRRSARMVRDDVLARDQRDRLAHAPVQGAMRDPRVAEAQHHVDAALVGAGLPRDERRMAVELDAGLRDRGLVLRRGHHGIDLARHRGLDGGGAERDRGAAADCGLTTPKPSEAVSGCGQASTLILRQSHRRRVRSRAGDFDAAGVRMPSMTPGSHTRIGSQAARTAGSSAALSAISGPMPAGSPTGCAILDLPSGWPHPDLL